MPSALSLSKTLARNSLRKLAPVSLARDVFFVPGWTDQACLSWTEPYMEGGTSRRAGWEYTIQDWIKEVLDDKSQSKVHFVKLVKDEKLLSIERFSSGSMQGQVKECSWDQDETYHYENFYQFAELFKDAVRSSGVFEYDLVGHSMGGLDIIAATVLDSKIDQELEITKYILTPPLENVHRIITVATPFRGSPAGYLVKHLDLDEMCIKLISDGVLKQAEAMSTDSPFIEIIVDKKRQQQLIQKLSGEVYTFGSENDIVVPNQNRVIDNAQNYPPSDFSLDQHSQRMGIPQDPRAALEIFRILLK